MKKIKTIWLLLIIITLFALEFYVEYNGLQVWAYYDIKVSKADMKKQKAKFEKEMQKYDNLIFKK